MMTGSALAIPWEAADIPAIVRCLVWRTKAPVLPLPMYSSVITARPAVYRLPFKKRFRSSGFQQLYDMTGRTYRYFTGEVLYPFGYGLSYTRFKYDMLSAPASAIQRKNITVKAPCYQYRETGWRKWCNSTCRTRMYLPKRPSKR